MPLYDTIADQNAKIASAQGITVYQPAAQALAPTDIASRYAASGDYIAGLDAQTRSVKAARDATQAASRTAGSSAEATAALAKLAQANLSVRSENAARIIDRAALQGTAAGKKAGRYAAQAAAAAGRDYERTMLAKARSGARQAAPSGGPAAGNGRGVNVRGKSQLQVARGYGYALNSSNYDTSSTTAGGNAARNKALNLARSYLGTRYVLGGTSTAGIDCSGLVMKVYSQLGYSIPVHGATWQGRNIPGVRVPWGSSKARPGDIVAWKDGSHIAIYAGGGQIIEAANPKVGTVQRGLWASPSAVTVIHLSI